MHSKFTLSFFSQSRLQKLTWHDGLIDSSEVWVKVGGDHGGGSMKWNFEIMNVDNPNSSNNTICWSKFEAHDKISNLTTALKLNPGEVDMLDGHKWK